MKNPPNPGSGRAELGGSLEIPLLEDESGLRAWVPNPCFPHVCPLTSGKSLIFSGPVPSYGKCYGDLLRSLNIRHITLGEVSCLPYFTEDSNPGLLTL